MNNKEDHNPFYDEKYFAAWGINPNESMHFYYDECNNCRKFTLNEYKRSFNTDINSDFVLAGVASDRVLNISFEELRTMFSLQKSAVELKSGRIFKGKSFIECLDSKYVSHMISFIQDNDLYIHYCHINNFFYTIVEILDSISDPREIYEYGFDYFYLKNSLYNLLFPNADSVCEVFCKYKYPNIDNEDVENFCNELLNCMITRYEQNPEEKYVTGMLKRASKKKELFFVQNNPPYVMQEDYSFFYASKILEYPNSFHHFDEELAIQGEIEKIVKKYGNGITNYEFIKSETNALVQVSDMISGLLGKLFTYINSVDNVNMRKSIRSMTPIQLTNGFLFNQLRKKSDKRNKGFLHSIAPIGMWRKIDIFFEMIESQYKKTVAG